MSRRPFPETVNLVSGAQVGLERGIVEVPDLPADSAFAYMKRRQPGHLMLERMDARAGCLESPEVDQTQARVLREVFTGAGVRP